MASALPLLLVACGAWSGHGSRESLGDAFAVYQIRHGRELSRMEEPHTELGPPSRALEAIMGELAKAGNSTSNSTEMYTRRKDLALQWTLLKAEPGANASISLNTGCGPRQPTKQSCRTKLTSKTHGKLTMVVRKKLIKTAKVKIGITPKVLFIEKHFSFECAACGKPCKGKVMGTSISMDMPRCPIRRTYTLQIPFGELTKAPIPFLEGTFGMTVQRADGTIVLDQKIHLSI